MLVQLLTTLLLAGGNLPAPEQLIRNAIAVRAAQEAKGRKFTWREDMEQKDEKGRPLHPFKHTYDVIMLEGENYRKLILIDDQPLDVKAAKKVETDLEKTREERKRHKFLKKAIYFGNLEQLERLFDSKVVGEELVGGRKTWRVESDAKPGIKGASAADAELLATHRITWFDEEDGIDLRRETTYVQTVNKIQAGTHGEIEWKKVADAWLPATSFFHGDIKFFPGVRTFGDSRHRFYDYKEFSAESTFTPN